MDTISTDQAILGELGEGLKRERLSRNLTQARVATEAGVTRDTVRRMEAGESVSTVNLVRVLRVLGLADALTTMLPDRGPGPLEQLRRGPMGRQRAGRGSDSGRSGREWRWGEEGES